LEADVDDSDDKVVPLKPAGTDFEPYRVAGVEIPAPPPSAQLDRQRKRLYEWICVQLARDGRQIRAAGIQIVMLVHTMDAWSKDMALCVSEGRYGTSDKGNSYELPHSYNERIARAEIKRELPEACLTVMSVIEAKLKESKTVGGQQDDLFGDLLDHAKARPAA
jgi:hypothetical protein